ncbi:tRNA threonylcarbamoyladenosine dehydratase [Wansuia hejianensis]|uniref:tRNA threonylcarbamoyladenosine dehydratase n=1 Tax=Wansuia hejianensis TaxID=2763667 RepID=A0A926F1X9_9FIRM|nr:tRNA threonylcarbamoyladenosine dehydratase [Wansuia hejianensis]MBC8590425.1 tRNA threonylcarbamoyladenosine dehydratase [Wansuia hejianensis]
MNNQFTRTEALIGKKAMEILSDSTVAIFGIGGVGSFTAEALIRSGLGKIILIDYDIIDISNINRQIHATFKTIGQPKVIAMKDRLLDINPNLNVVVHNTKYNLDSKQFLLNKDYDYVVDAIDMVSSKVDLIVSAQKMGIPVISSMGAGNKLSPTMFKIGDIYDTKICPLAKVMRNQLRKKGVKDLKVVWSEETPLKVNLGETNLRKAVPGSISFVPSTAGLIIASEVIKDLIREEV